MKKIYNLMCFAVVCVIAIGIATVSIIANIIMAFGGSHHNVLFKVANATENLYWEDIPHSFKQCLKDDKVMGLKEWKELGSDIAYLYRQ